MDTLKTIQTLAKVGKVLSHIVFVFSIVGFCLCAAGIVSLALGGDTLQLGGTTIHGIIENETDLNTPTLVSVIAVIMLYCAAEAVLSKFAEVYFKNELADGTPFTQRGAKELLRLGILIIAIPVGTVILASIALSIADNFYPTIEKVSYDEYTSVGMGVMAIIMSLFCRHGAELLEGKN
ncbi:MAG: hypothetical protein J6Y62_05650 [Clostridia bacterium]|nr:hypothetical protein [Clostridia bacterium]